MILIKSVPSTIVSVTTLPLLFDKIACNGPRPARDECKVRRRWLSTSRAGLVLGDEKNGISCLVAGKQIITANAYSYSH